MVIKVLKVLNKVKVTDYESGARFFNLFKEHISKNPDDKELILDFEGVLVFTQVPFKTLISSMRSRLEGDYAVKLINQNQFINKSFENSLS